MFKKPDFFRLFNVAVLAAVCLMLFVFWPASCEAGNATVSWDHPTSYVDNTPLAIADIARTEIRWGKCNAAKTDFAEPGTTFGVSAPTATATIPAIPTGAYCFAARTVTMANEASDWTPVVSKDVTNIPGKPQNFVVTLSL